MCWVVRIIELNGNRNLRSNVGTKESKNSIYVSVLLTMLKTIWGERNKVIYEREQWQCKRKWEEEWQAISMKRHFKNCIEIEVIFSVKCFDICHWPNEARVWRFVTLMCSRYEQQSWTWITYAKYMVEAQWRMLCDANVIQFICQKEEN